MAAGNFGAVPVVDPLTHRLVGMITDRDITCRITAVGGDPTRIPVQEGMSQNVAALAPEASLQDCFRLLETRQVRRAPIVDARGTVLGIVAQADLARATARKHELEHELAELMEEVSAPPPLVSGVQAG
jgi:CBS domain-containing protein